MSGLTGWMGPSALAVDASDRLEAMLAPLVTLDDADVGRGKLEGLMPDVRVAWTHRRYEAPVVAWNEARNLCLVFLGEDYDLPSNAARLGEGSPGPTPAATLLRLFEKFGSAAVTWINGRFSGLLVDLRTQTTTLFNDRYGLNRIYWSADRDGFHFATKASSLLAVLPASRALDPRGLGEYYSVGCVLQNRSLYPGIEILPPASWWTVSKDGTVRRTQYFDPAAWESQSRLSPEEYSRQLIDVFGRVAPKYLAGTEPVGMSLTGGLDSRMILAWAQRPAGTLPCYTFGGPFRDCADVTIARKLAGICGQPHQTLRIGDDFFTEFPRLAEQTVRVSDGTMDVSGAVELYVNRQARAIAPFRLTGNYGSEILRANVAFRPARLDRSLFTPEFIARLDEAEATYRTEASSRRLSFIAFKQVPWHHYSRFAAESAQLTPRSPFLDNELVALAYRAPAELETSPGPILRLIAAGNPKLDIDSDRALRARAIPVYSRLKHSWQEFTAKAEYAYDYGMPQRLVSIDRMLGPLHLERLFLGRHKFYHFRTWYRHDLAEAIRGIAKEVSAPSIYRNSAASEMIDAHTSGRANRTLEIHKLLSSALLSQSVRAPSCRN